jgi:hypothetical protein
LIRHKTTLARGDNAQGTRIKNPDMGMQRESLSDLILAEEQRGRTVTCDGGELPFTEEAEGIRRMAFRGAELTEYIIVGGYNLPLSALLAQAQAAGIKTVEQTHVSHSRYGQADRIEGFALELQMLAAQRLWQDLSSFLSGSKQTAKNRTASADNPHAIQAMPADGCQRLLACRLLIGEVDQQIVVIPQDPHAVDLFQADRAQIDGQDGMQPGTAHQGPVGVRLAGREGTAGSRLTESHAAQHQWRLAVDQTVFDNRARRTDQEPFLWPLIAQGG